MSDEGNKGRFVKGDPRLHRGGLPGKRPAVNVFSGKPRPDDGGKAANRRAKRAVSARFLEDLANHYHEEGHQVFKIVFRENHDLYFKALVSLVPKELLINQTVNIFGELTDEQIAQTVDKVRQLRLINGSGNGVVIEQ